MNVFRFFKEQKIHVYVYIDTSVQTSEVKRNVGQHPTHNICSSVLENLLFFYHHINDVQQTALFAVTTLLAGTLLKDFS